MAETTTARKGELLRELLALLRRHPDGLQASDALRQLAEQVTMTQHEAGDYESGTRRFEKIVRFSSIKPVKAGWLVKQQGIWSITEDGMTALTRFPQPEAFYREANRLYRQWRQAQPDSDEALEADLASGSASITLEQAEEMAWEEISQYLSSMPPYAFQELVASLLKAMGYHVTWIAPPGKDGGVDILAFNDPLGTRPPRIKVQVKRNAGSPRIDVTGLRSFMAVLGEDDVGLFVALSGFTKDAEFEARQSHRRLTLIDARKLVQLWTGHHEHLDDLARQRFPLKPVWFLSSGQD